MTKNPNRITEVYGQFKNPAGANCALVKTANGAAYFVLPSETNGEMPKVGATLDTTKHQQRVDSPYPQTLTQIEMLTALRRTGYSFTATEFQGGAKLIGHTTLGYPIYEMTFKDDDGSWSTGKLYGAFHDQQLHLEF